MKHILSFILAALIGAAAYGQEKRMAVVEFSTSYLRLQPDYESPLETQELMGTVVEIVGESGYWREVQTPQPYKAWCTDQGLVEMNAEELKAYEEAPKVIFTELYGHVYKWPSDKADTICDLVGGDMMRFVSKKGKWTMVMLPSGKTGYVRSHLLKKHEGFMSIAMGEGSAESISPQTTEAIIAEAERLLGVPYLWGGMSAKGVDCSGLVRISHIMNGILLPRNASQQIKCGDRVAMEVDPSFHEDGSRQNPDGRYSEAFVRQMKERVMNLKRGDLVYFGTPATAEKPMRVTHVGIYLGDNRIIHSSHRVRINSLIPGDADYYENAHRLIAATRL
ncbi:MAG: C40 family peptidase [Bacteroidales bacterium]|nr:C40 family peptidase [Bacteroidales bacterium]